MSGHPDLSRLAGALPEADRLAILTHVGACAACRAALASDDPSALFSLLVLREADPDALEAVSREVATRLPREHASWVDAWRERGLPRFLPLAAAAAAVAAVLAVTLPGGTPPGEGTEAVFDASRARADVRVTETPGPAQVVDLTVGDTQVVMIFAAEIDL